MSRTVVIWVIVAVVALGGLSLFLAMHGSKSSPNGKAVPAQLK